MIKKGIQTASYTAAPSTKVQFSGIELPIPILFSIFGMGRLQAAHRIGRTSKAAQFVFTRYIREKLFLSKLSSEVLIEAESQGIQLNYSLLYRLSLDVQGPFNHLCRLSTDCIWPLAAVSGDETWINHHLKDTIKTVRCHSGKDIVYYLSFGGHLNIIQKSYTDILKEAQQEKAGNTEYYYIANAAGHFELCDYIKNDFGQSLHEANKFGQRDIHFACQYGDLTRVKSLQKSESDLGIFQYRDRWGCLPIAYATRGGALNVITYIAKLDREMVVKVDQTRGENLLHLAASSGRDELIDSLIDMGCDPKALDHDNDPPLRKTPYGNWACFLKLLPKSDQYISTINGEYQPLLFIAARIGAVEFIINYVSRYGVTCLKYNDVKGSTFVHELMNCKNIRQIRILYNRFKIDMTTVDRHGNTPLLHIALKIDEEYKRSNQSPIMQSSFRHDWNFVSDFFHEYRKQLGDDALDQNNPQNVTLRVLIEKNNQQALFLEMPKSSDNELPDDSTISSDEDEQFESQKKCCVCQ